MNGLERELAAITLDVGPVPDFETRVRSVLTQRRRRRRVGALAVLAAALTLTAAVVAPTSRSAMLQWLGLGGVTLERVADLPPAGIRTPRYLGDPVQFSTARDAVDFPVRVPRLAGLGERHVFLDDEAPSPVVTIVYGSPENPLLLLSEWRGDTRPHFHKLIGFSARTERVRIGGAPGLWVEGPPHEIFYLATDGSFANTPVYTFGDVLIWVRRGVSHRLELIGSLADARQVAGSLD